MLPSHHGRLLDKMQCSRRITGACNPIFFSASALPSRRDDPIYSPPF